MNMITRFLKLILPLPTPHLRRSDYSTLFRAIRLVESGGEYYAPYAVGDSGRSIGPYQISFGYWIDAYNYDPDLDGTWAMCVDQTYAEQVMMQYWQRHAPKDATWEVLARIHNGGPNGYHKAETQQYWKRVVRYL
tara:strand:+ start:202 stop:606 length:405 start_codon:yes stop_codon:yes gene_type:complete